MTKEAFQTRALVAIRRELKKGTVPLERVRAFASAILDLGILHSGEVPPAAVDAVIRAFPEFSPINE